MKVAAIQMVSTTDLQTNLQSARRLLEQAAKEGAELAVLPEYFCLLGARDTDKLQIQEPYGSGPIQQFLSAAARELGLWLVAGTLPISTASDARALPSADAKSASRVYNSSLAFSPSGECVARYDKIHLFKFDSGQEQFDESRVLVRGETPTTFDLCDRAGCNWRIGMSVCYDLRFPELYRLYADQGVDVLLVPSAFTYTTGQAHWEVLLRARAIENQAFVMAAAQGGAHQNGRRTWGHSMLVDPWGRILAETPEHEGVVCADFSTTERQICRDKIAVLSHRVIRA